ncbi:MAG: septum site-determining protein MinD [Proteobacteria bacterium]|nr:septum site-determining protein MinD [Pseudomonadota bacterium]
MSKVIVVTSGKGGVGKTTTSASFAMGLANAGYKTVVIDFDIGLRNLDLVMGCERRVIYDVASIIHGEASVKQTLIKDKNNPNLQILAASQTRDKNILTLEAVSRIMEELRQSFDFIVCDSPAGIEQGALMAMYFADCALVVSNPEVSSVRDADRILGFLDSKTLLASQGKEIEKYLVVTRYALKRVSSGDMMSLEDIKELLGIPLLAVISECPSVLKASNLGEPVILDKKSKAGQDYQQLIRKFLHGRSGDVNEAIKKPTFLQRLFKNNRELVA